MSDSLTNKTFASTFQLLYYLTEHKLIESIEIDIQGGMWRYMYMHGSGIEALPTQERKKL